MKKVMLLMISVLLTLSLFSCKEDKPLVAYNYNYYDYMNTFITVNFMTYDDQTAATYESHIVDMLSMYHDLTDNYRDLSIDSTYLENIYSINQKIGQQLEIDEPLYRILEEAKSVETLTDGYFDITIGKAIDVWKSLIEANYDNNIIPDVNYQAALDTINTLDFSLNGFNLSEIDGHYYIQTQGENTKLDLGAIAKGYVTQQISNYLSSEGVEYYFINSGSSSLYLALNSNVDRDYFNIGLTCPICDQSGTYGTVQNVMNQSVTTSGDYEQFVLHNDLRYHHIVSPVTKMPMQYYHTVTLIGDDAGLLDALSTALFSMPNDIFNAWMDAHQNELNLSYIRFNYDETITQSLLGDLVFERN